MVPHENAARASPTRFACTMSTGIFMAIRAKQHAAGGNTGLPVGSWHHTGAFWFTKREGLCLLNH